MNKTIHRREEKIQKSSFNEFKVCIKDSKELHYNSSENDCKLQKF